MPTDAQLRLQKATSTACAAAEHVRCILNVKKAALAAFLRHGDPASEMHLASANLAVRGALIRLRDHTTRVNELEQELFKPPDAPPPPKKQRAAVEPCEPRCAC